MLCGFRGGEGRCIAPTFVKTLDSLIRQFNRHYSAHLKGLIVFNKRRPTRPPRFEPSNAVPILHKRNCDQRARVIVCKTTYKSFGWMIRQAPQLQRQLAAFSTQAAPRSSLLYLQDMTRSKILGSSILPRNSAASDSGLFPEKLRCYQSVIRAINKHSIPVAITYGNHDAEDEFTRSDMRKLESVLEHFVEKKNAFIVDDRESYTVEIYDAKGESIQNVLYVIDSGADAPLPIGQYDWVHPEQVNWFREVSKPYKREDEIVRKI